MEYLFRCEEHSSLFFITGTRNIVIDTATGIAIEGTNLKPRIMRVTWTPIDITSLSQEQKECILAVTNSESFASVSSFDPSSN